MCTLFGVRFQFEDGLKAFAAARDTLDESIRVKDVRLEAFVNGGARQMSNAE